MTGSSAGDSGDIGGARRSFDDSSDLGGKSHRGTFK